MLLRGLQLGDHGVELGGRERALWLGVLLGRLGEVGGVGGDAALAHGLVVDEADHVVEAAHVGAAGGLAREGALAGAHARVHVVEHCGGDLEEVLLADVGADGLEAAVELLHAGVGVVAGRPAVSHEAVALVGEGGAGPARGLAALDLGYEVAEHRLGLGQGAAHALGAGLVLAVARVLAARHAQLPLSALALGLVLFELDDGALAPYARHVSSPPWGRRCWRPRLRRRARCVRARDVLGSLFYNPRLFLSWTGLPDGTRRTRWSRRSGGFFSSRPVVS